MIFYTAQSFPDFMVFWKFCRRVNGIRFAGRATKGVRIFNTAADEKVVSVELVSDVGEDESEDDSDAANADNEAIISSPDSGAVEEGDA